jgi:phage/plasmid-associated DNA primase
MPTLPGFDDAIRRRVRLIPCGAGVPDGEQVKKLGEKLAAEDGEAILASMVWGAVTYFAEGELRPDEVELATAEYESEQNTVQLFWEACCQQVPNFSLNGGAPLATTQAQSRIEYLAFCQDMRLTAETSHPFHRKFRAMPGVQWDEKNKRYLGLMISRGSSDSYQRGDIHRTWNGE